MSFWETENPEYATDETGTRWAKWFLGDTTFVEERPVLDPRDWPENWDGFHGPGGVVLVPGGEHECKRPKKGTPAQP